MASAQAAGDGDARVALRAAAELRRTSERMEAQLVRRARNQGLSWAEVAAQLGVSKQAVHHKHRGRGLLGTGREP
ncbi:helix-turn-helix domain-containing protein [Modestobacter sp. I12A-02662]|uniref:helix-turn-helix domain-containing protein n=1 Tax=Modestobacter sp. I12A-02662 TaxID=1730496 RepID=UPI0034E05709